jgi:hypothetical protein
MARLGRLLALAVISGMGVAFLVWAVTGWTLADAVAYWQAALRLRAGQDLYPAVTNVAASDVFRYSPWFAWAAVPLTFLPLGLVAVAWSVALVVASTVAVWPLVRERRWMQLCFFWPILIAISASGNVQAILIACLVHGVERRSGPLWIALAASLKAVPLLFALVYLGRGQWLRAALSVVLTVALVAPVLFYDLSQYPTDTGGAGLLIRWMPLYVLTALVVVSAAVRLAATRYAWLSAATAAALVLPRFFTYDVTLLLVGTVRRARPASQA